MPIFYKDNANVIRDMAKIWYKGPDGAIRDATKSVKVNKVYDRYINTGMVIDRFKPWEAESIVISFTIDKYHKIDHMTVEHHGGHDSDIRWNDINISNWRNFLQYDVNDDNRLRIILRSPLPNYETSFYIRYYIRDIHGIYWTTDSYLDRRKEKIVTSGEEYEAGLYSDFNMGLLNMTNILYGFSSLGLSRKFITHNSDSSSWYNVWARPSQENLSPSITASEIDSKWHNDKLKENLFGFSMLNELNSYSAKVWADHIALIPLKGYKNYFTQDFEFSTFISYPRAMKYHDTSQLTYNFTSKQNLRIKQIIVTETLDANTAPWRPVIHRHAPKEIINL